MVANPPEGFPRITPYLLYEDCAAALDFLTKAFGFTEEVRIAGPDGKVNHAEVRLADGVVMMGTPGPDYQNPGAHGHAHSTVYVYVDDVDKHFEQAKSAGAKILSELEDAFYGDRNYAAEDPQGHQWSFATHTRDVAPEDMHP